MDGEGVDGDLERGLGEGGGGEEGLMARAQMLRSMRLIGNWKTRFQW